MRLTRGRGGLSTRRRSFRRGQSAVLFLLATLVVLACAGGPWYERAVEEATLHATLDDASRTSRGLSITTDGNVSLDRVTPSGAARRLFGQPIASIDVFDDYQYKSSPSLTSTITYREHLCAHLTMTAGRCRLEGNETIASAPLAKRIGLTVGQQLTVISPGAEGADNKPLKVRVVGLYQPFSSDDDYWFGANYSSRSGYRLLEVGPGGASYQADAMFGSLEFVEDTGASQQLGPGAPVYTVSVPLATSHVGIDDLPLLRKVVTRLDNTPDGVQSVNTGLMNYLDSIDRGRRDARRIVFAIAIQLALLSMIAFGVVAAAAADQRRPELALARLRGRSPVRAAAVFVREIGGLVLAAVVPAVLLAWGLVTAAAHLLLVPGVTAEFRWPVFATAAAAVLVILAVVATIGLRASRQPITDMLREVPKTASRTGLGTAEAVLAALAIAGLLVTTTGGKDNAFASLTPTFIAVVVGLVLSRGTAVAGRIGGRRALWRSDVSRALAGLAIARRSGGRFTITVLCVATAVVIFAGQQWSVARTNRIQRAAATVGAPVVLDVQSSTGEKLRQAVHDADPGGHYATPVVIVTPPGRGATPTVAIEPASFDRIATWGRASQTPSRASLDRVLPTSAPPPITFTGTTVAADISASSYTVTRHLAGNPKPDVHLVLTYQHSDGRPGSVDLGRLSDQSTRPVTLRGDTQCSDGCEVTGVRVQRQVFDSDPIDVSVTVSSLRAGRTFTLGSAKHWASVTVRAEILDSGTFARMTASDARSGLTFHALDQGDGDAMQYLSTPIGLPALIAGPRPDNNDELGYLIAGALDGGVQRVVVKKRISFVPQVGGAAVVLSLPLLARASSFLDPTAHPSVWLGRDDPARERSLVAALSRDGVTVTGRHTTARALSQYDDSAPGWSAELTLAVAVISELLAMALLVLVVLTSRRSRQQDLAAMRLIGLSRRRLRAASLIELLTYVIVGVLGGTIAGVIAVRLSLSSIPIFTAAPIVPLPTLFPVEWLWLAGGIVVSGVLLVGATIVLVRQLVRGATPRRLAGDTL